MEKKDDAQAVLRRGRQPNYFFRRYVILPLGVLGLCTYHGAVLSLPGLISAVFSGSYSSDGVIPLGDAAKEMGTNVAYALLSVAYAALVDTLRSLHVLL